MSVGAVYADCTLRRLDAWRRSPRAEPTDDGSYKEWLHFCVRLPGKEQGHLLANFNVTERSLPSGTVREARVITLLHLRGQWRGHVNQIPEMELHGGAGDVGVRFGANSIGLDAGVFEMKLRCSEIKADLRLRPTTLPTGNTSVSLGSMHSLQWVAVPHLLASGTVSFGDRCLRLEDTAAYHDHNWGQFRWGSDLAWDWGFVHPSDSRCPWTVVFVRVSDGLRHRTLNQFILVWKGDAYVRAFLNQELSVETRGTHVGPRPFTLPGVMSLLVPGAASGVPRTIALRATSLDDELSLEYEVASTARVALPSDVHPLRTTLLNETEGTARVRGRIGGEAFAFEGDGISEFVRG